MPRRPPGHLVIAMSGATKQSTAENIGKMDCFAPLAMTANSKR
jgi:hypothetical protein